LFLTTVILAQTRVKYNLKIIYPDKSEREYNMNLDVEGKARYFYDQKLLDNTKYPSKSNRLLFNENTDNQNVQIFTAKKIYLLK